MSTERYFEDFTVGQTFRSNRVGISRERIIAFAQEFDPQPQHMSDEAAAQSQFGRLIASGWHTAAVTMSLFVRNIHPVAGGGQGVGVDGIAWARPVLPGDELRVETEVIAARASKSKPDKGLVTVRDRTFNQKDELVQTMTHTFMALKRRVD